ncbi:MAG: molybdenum ABC transporter ATP-binding protein [Salinivirgaceae bacterium]|jgi:molybdate transport system ATP-binding protein|nr:molybdenum ABC transporter ATP-binding protein [Salinivirgaceae bacterium]
MLNINIKISQGDFTGNYEFSAKPGVMGIFGASGHGKTSLLNAIVGLLNPECGKIEINGKQIFNSNKKINLSIQKRKVAYVFQDYKLFPHFSVLKNLQYGISKKADKNKAHEIAKLLGIDHLLNKSPQSCSGGEKQRIALGRTLLTQPELLLMDEPFASVDSNLREELMQYVKMVAAEYQIPILIVSHDFNDMLKLMDTVMYIENGHITYCGDIFQVLSQNDFLSNEKLFQQYQNILNLEVVGPREMADRILYETINEPTGMRFLIESFVSLKVKDEVRVVLSPDDIVMATRPVYEISTSNQISGTLLRVIESPYMVKCVVDIGFPVLVSITTNAFDRLGFGIGDKVWLQFKTTKINVAANYSSKKSKLRIA